MKKCRELSLKKLTGHRRRLIAAIFLISSPVSAMIETGRVSFGGYTAHENILTASGGTNSNDFQTLSSRFYLKLEKLGDFDLVTDLRDTHDFFDKLDAQNLALTGANSFQIFEASVRYPNVENSFYATVGRFSIPEAGAVFVDGSDLGMRLSSDTRVGIFAGHNPRRPQDTYMRGDNPDAIYGTYLGYRSSLEVPSPGELPSGKFFNGSFAFVTNSMNGFTDRQYLYSNNIYQYRFDGRVISNLYLDMVPNAYLQNGDVLWQQAFNHDWDAALQVSSIDTITYSEIRNVLETLPSSSYQEISSRTRYTASENSQYLGELRWGERNIDGKVREEVKLGYHLAGWIAREFDFTASGGFLSEFITQGPELSLELNYFSRFWEFGARLDAAIEARMDGDPNNPGVLHPLTTEIHVAQSFQNAVFSSVAFQFAQNETVTVFAGFFKVTYRFGPSDLASIRDKTSIAKSLR